MKKKIWIGLGILTVAAMLLLVSSPRALRQLRKLGPRRNIDIKHQAIEDMRDSGILDKALQKGDKIPEFELPDVRAGIVRSRDLLAQGPLVIIFYRGSWCPYCNIQLHDFQKHLSRIKELGANLVAISPQTPDNSLSTAEKGALEFYVLSDVNIKVEKSFGLSYRVPDDVARIHIKNGVDLAWYNGNNDWQLPLALTYVVARDGTIVYAFRDVDYRKRPKSEEILRVLKKMKRAWEGSSVASGKGR
jgi:peroxiredoxin